MSLFKRNPHIIRDCVVHSLTNVLLFGLLPQCPGSGGQKLASQFYIYVSFFLAKVFIFIFFQLFKKLIFN